MLWAQQGGYAQRTDFLKTVFYFARLNHFNLMQSSWKIKYFQSYVISFQ